jgi:hypothetical protein
VHPLVRSEAGLVVLVVAAALVTYVGLAITVSGQEHLAGLLVLLGGLWSLRAAPRAHDRLHQEHGEPSHALWGRNDRFKPSWWPW